MSFTYDITNTTDISSLMRREIGDTRLDPNGVLPEGRNLTDAELDYFYDQEDDDFWLAIARAFDAIAAEYARYPESFKMGPEEQKIPAATYYSSRAQEIRTGTLVPASFSVAKDEIAMDLD